MSRQIDTTQPLSDEDRAYLADRGRTPEQERERQDTVQLAADIVTGNAEALPSRIEYARRTGQADPRAGLAPMYVNRSGAAV